MTRLQVVANLIAFPPMPQNPYFQSGRLVPPATGGAAGLNRTLINKMDQTLAELKVPNTPLPTKRVCDLYDSVRKDILLLLTLQKMVMQKEGNLQSKRVKLSKLRGGDRDILDEEALLGIAPPPTAPVSTAATSAAPQSPTLLGAGVASWATGGCHRKPWGGHSGQVE